MSERYGRLHEAWNKERQNKDLQNIPDDMIHEMNDYIAYLEKELETPISIVSVGPDRKQ